MIRLDLTDLPSRPINTTAELEATHATALNHSPDTASDVLSAYSQTRLRQADRGMGFDIVGAHNYGNLAGDAEEEDDDTKRTLCTLYQLHGFTSALVRLGES